MQGVHLLGVSLLTTILLATGIPTSASVPFAADDDPWVAWFRSDGTSGVGKLSEFEDQDASEQHCYGVAPLETTCTLAASGVASYAVGWTAPTTENVPVGALVSALDLEMTGSNGGRITGHCDIAAAGVVGQFVGAGTGIASPFWCRGWDLSIPPGGVRPAGEVTVMFTTNDYHPQPGGGDPTIPMAQVGTWHALLVTA